MKSSDSERILEGFLEDNPEHQPRFEWQICPSCQCGLSAELPLA